MLPHHINFDLVLQVLLNDMATVLDCWRNGRPRDEPALLHRMTERLVRYRGACNVGVDHPMQMLADYYHLHRQGLHQVDRFGSDLAVTIRIPDMGLIKTAFFQLKISRNHRTALETDQLREGTHFLGVHERSFVVAVDDEAFAFRIRSSGDCLWHIPEGQNAMQFETSTWDCLSAWLLEWFACKRGLPTHPNETHPVEGMLEGYKLAAERDMFDSIIQANLPIDRIPAKGWLDYSFMSGARKDRLEG